MGRKPAKGDPDGLWVTRSNGMTVLTTALNAPVVVRNLENRVVLDRGPDLLAGPPDGPQRWTFEATRTRPAFRVESAVTMRGEITELTDGSSLELRFSPSFGAGAMTIVGIVLTALSLLVIAGAIAAGDGPWLQGVGGALLFGVGLVAHRRELDQIKEALEREVLLCCVERAEASRSSAARVDAHRGFALTGFASEERLAARTEDWAMDDLEDRTEALNAAAAWISHQAHGAVVEVIAMVSPNHGEVVGHVSSDGFEPLH